jgi:hypothetical protein
MLFLSLLGEYLKEFLIKAIKEIISSTGNWHDRHRHTPLGPDFGWHRMDSDVCMQALHRMELHAGLRPGAR